MSKNEPRFLPPEGKSEHHIARTDGHSIVIHSIFPDDSRPGTPIPLSFRADAIGAGCGIVGIDLASTGPAAKTDKGSLIAAAIAAVMERQDPAELEGDGRPSLDALKKQAGFGVTKAQLEAAWVVYVDGLDGDDDTPDEV